MLTGLVTDAWIRVRLVEDEQIAPGIVIFGTAGNQRSLLAVMVRTERGTAIMSDSFFGYENVTENRPPSMNESIDEILAPYDRTRRKADILIPLCDPRVIGRHPSGRVA